MPGTTALSSRKPISARRPASKRVTKRVTKKTTKVAKPKGGPYIAPRRPVSSGGEGPSVSTYTPYTGPVSSGGESGGGGGGYVAPASYSYGGSSGGE